MDTRLQIILPAEQVFASLVQCKNPYAALLFAYGMAQGGTFSQQEGASALEISDHEAKKACDCLLAYGICKKGGQFVQKPVVPTPEELLALTSSDFGFQGITKVYEGAKGTYLTRPEIDTLYDIYTNLSLSADMIVLLIATLKDKDRFGRRNVEKMAYEWNDLGIDSYEAAENYMQARFSKAGKYKELLAALAITGRDPVASEKKYLDSWLEKDLSPALVAYAYEKMIFNVGQLKWPYINKILESWHAAGYKTREEVDGGEGQKQTAPAKPTGAKAPTATASRIAQLTKEYDTLRHNREQAAADLMSTLMQNHPEFAKLQRTMGALSQKIAATALLGGDVSELRAQNRKLAQERQTLLERLGYSEAVLFPKPNCPKCNDYGYIGSELCECLKHKLEQQ